jgi:acetyl esterase/lipase
MTVAESTNTAEIRLWPDVAPGSDAATQQETSFVENDLLILRNVVTPMLTPYLPDPVVANGTAVIIAPGGGFFMLSWENEGTKTAEWLRDRGVACFVLKYRIADTGPTQADFVAYMGALAAYAAANLAATLEPLLQAGAAADGIRAMHLVRERAAEWNVDPDRVGMLGFSAGGFLATYVGLEAPPAARPDFIVAIYGGDARSGVGPDAPPLFTLVAADDPICLRACVDTFERWRAAGRPAELHVYAQGGHGFGMARRGLPVDTWIERVADWIPRRDTCMLAKTLSATPGASAMLARRKLADGGRRR